MSGPITPDVARVLAGWRHMSRTVLLVVFGVLPSMPGALLAQAARDMPDIRTMAEDYNYASILQKRCRQFVAVDDAEAEKLQTLILRLMLEQHGKARTEEALHSALERMATEARELGLAKWCEVEAGLWAAIRYPALLRE